MKFSWLPRLPKFGNKKATMLLQYLFELHETKLDMKMMLGRSSKNIRKAIKFIWVDKIGGPKTNWTSKIFSNIEVYIGFLKLPIVNI